jgi:hypothetical protein
VSEKLPSESPQSFSREAALEVLKAAAAQGPVDPDVEQFLRGIVEGAPKRQIEAALGREKYQEVRTRVLAYAQRLERS